VCDARADTNETFRSFIFSSCTITVINIGDSGQYTGTLHNILNNVLEEQILPGRSSVRFEGSIHVTDLNILLQRMVGFSSLG